MAQPVRKFRIGAVTASIWENDSDGRKFHTVTLQRSYKDDNGEWQSSDGLAHGDLLNTSKLLVRSENWIAEQ